MTVISRQVHPPNSLLLVSDSASTDVPTTMGGRLAAFTPSTVAIGTLSESDGSTRVVITDERPLSHPEILAFNGTLHIQGGTVVVQSILGERYLELPWRTADAHMWVWVNHPMEPDEVLIEVRQP